MRTLVVAINALATTLLICALFILVNHYSQSHASTFPMKVTQIPRAVMKPLPKIKAEHRKSEWKWLRYHSQINRRVKKGAVDVLFLGDSLTQGWGHNPTWQVFYGHRRAVNAGIWSDRTQHLLWRIRNGNVDGIEPKAIVLLIGGNNLMMESPRKVAGGIVQNIKELRTRLPRTKIIVVGILPGGRTGEHARRSRGRRVNTLLRDAMTDPAVIFADIGDRFLTKKGRLPKKFSRDGLHLTRLGYAVFARAIEPKLSRILGQRAVVAGNRDLPARTATKRH